jgi:hypothetical protein
MNDVKFRETPVGNNEAILSEALLGNVQRLWLNKNNTP